MIAVKLPIALLLVGIVGCSWQDRQVPRTVTSLGGISGYYKYARNGRQYEAYEGIPYAEPPVGSLRFQPPLPVQKWDAELPATKKGSICTQYLMANMVNGDRVTGCEDCLYLNIYVPVRNGTNTLLPVMFWIHGGAFQFASGNEADETLLMERDVILVTINYRLGPFGFLSTGDGVVSGNMGLKDQSLALRWVNDNIKNFNGDPKQITIFGMNAGGASVHYHYMSPLSAGLFQRGISISGVALDPWAQVERAHEKAKELGARTGCPTRNMAEMIICLQERPARLIAQAVGDFMVWLYNPFTPFGPVVEKEASKPFISRSPANIINRGEAVDVPWITGAVSQEGLFTAAEFVANDELLKQLNDNWTNIAPYLLDYNDTVSLDHHKPLAALIRKQYLGAKEINSENVRPVINIMTDRLFAFDYEKAARMQARVNKSPVWTYHYSYRAARSLSEALSGGSTKNFGVSQGDDIFLILQSFLSNTTRPTDLEMQQVLLDFYTSFAIQGTPRVGNATWQPLNPYERGFHYLHIESPTNVTMECSNNFAQRNFWSKLNIDENDHEDEDEVCPRIN